MTNIPVIAVVGPTASGKTRLGAEIALHFGGEVVSCDSMQLYKTMDIATAKPTAAEMMGVPHHLVDILPPESPFSLAEYVRLASSAIADISKRGKLPVIVGGTGLYIDTLLFGIRLCDEGEDAEYRAYLSKIAEKEGGERLLSMLKECDPDYAAGVHANNIPRLIRALEVYHSTGIPLSEHIRRSRPDSPPYDALWLGIRFNDRGKLYERINLRVDGMLDAGLIEEAKAAYSVREQVSTSAQAIGCKELYPYIEGEKSLSECIENLKRSTRRYAKRQLTWFSRNNAIHWLEPDVITQEGVIQKAFELTEEFLSNKRS